MTAIMHDCEICHKLVPALNIFRWDSEVEKHNTAFNHKNVCSLCYKILQEKSCKINDEGRVIEGFKFYRL